MRTLSPLNSATFFCRTCGIGQAGSCCDVQADAAESEVYRFAARTDREEYSALAVLTVCAAGFLIACLAVWIAN